jgi:hypothetical protein
MHSRSQRIYQNYLDTKLLSSVKAFIENLYDYQEQLLQEIRVIRRVMANVKEASKVSLKDKIRVSFNAPGIQNVLVQNFSWIPPCLDIHCAYHCDSICLSVRLLTSKTPIDFADRHCYAT